MVKKSDVYISLTNKELSKNSESGKIAQCPAIHDVLQTKGVSDEWRKSSKLYVNETKVVRRCLSMAVTKKGGS
jgi:hypothetical protein